MKIRIAIAALALLAGGCSSSDREKTVDSGQPSASASFVDPGEVGLASPAVFDAPGFNMPLVIGPLTYTVTGSTCGIKSVMVDKYFTAEPDQGSFCKVAVTVKNTSKAPVFFGVEDQNAWAGDTQYVSISTIEVGDAGTKNFYGTLNPNQSGHGFFWFDVPSGVKLTDLEITPVDVSATNGQNVLVHLR